MRRLIALLVLPALVLVACGGDDDSSSASSGGKTTTTEGGAGGGGASCPDEGTIGDIAGAPSKAPDVTELPDGIQCTYSVEDAPNGVFGVVNIRLYTDDAAGALDTFKAVADDEEKVDVAVGDEAWWAPSVTDLFVVYQDVGVDILLSGLGDGDDAKAIAIALAKPALA
jgi:hypothetical protein